MAATDTNGDKCPNHRRSFINTSGHGFAFTRNYAAANRCRSRGLS